MQKTIIPLLPDDRNVGPAEYRSLSDCELVLLTSVFYTFQGEGPYGGRPSVFLRLSGCNLGTKEWCPWCDADFRYGLGRPVGAGELSDFIGRYVDRTSVVVITGGEPLLQWDALRQVLPEIEQRLDRPLVWQFETNGIFLTEKILRDAKDLQLETLFVVSPKIVRKDNRYTPIPAWYKEYPDAVELKFVVSADPESPYHQLPEELPLGVTVYLSGQTHYGEGDELAAPGKPANLLLLSEEAREQTAKNYAYAAQLALERGFLVSYQTHLLGNVE